MTTRKSKATDGALDAMNAAALDLASVAFNEAYLASMNGSTASLSTHRGVRAAIHAYLSALPKAGGDLASEIAAKIEALISEERQGAFIGLHQVRAIEAITTRIRSSLAALPPPTGEPVAWARAADINGLDDLRSDVTLCKVPRPEHGLDMPLYGTPQPRDELERALREILFARKPGPTPKMVPGTLIERIENIAKAAIERAPR